MVALRAGPRALGLFDHLASVSFVDRNTPLTLKSSGQAFFSASTYGAGGIAGRFSPARSLSPWAFRGFSIRPRSWLCCPARFMGSPFSAVTLEDPRGRMIFEREAAESRPLAGRGEGECLKIVDVGNVRVGGGAFSLIAGPCVIESEEKALCGPPPD